MQRIEPVEPSQMTGPVKEKLEAVKKKLGRVPNVHATMANSAAVLDAYLGFDEAMSRSTLDPKLRELVAVAVAEVNGCEYCLSAHTAAGKGLKLDSKALEKARDAESEDSKWQEALTFAASVVEKRGQVTSAQVEQLKAAGFGDAQVLELVALAVLNTFTNYVNLAAGTEVDFPKVPVHAHS